MFCCGNRESDYLATYNTLTIYYKSQRTDVKEKFCTVFALSLPFFW